MDREVIFDQLRNEYEEGRVSKPTAVNAMNFYNQNVEADKKLKGCLCTVAKRRISARMMLEWYEERY